MSIFRTTILLSDHLWQLDIPFIVCRSMGFIGSIRLQLKELTIVESHPDNKSSDLRLIEPFEALQKHFQVTCYLSIYKTTLFIELQHIFDIYSHQY